MIKFFEMDLIWFMLIQNGYFEITNLVMLNCGSWKECMDNLLKLDVSWMLGEILELGTWGKVSVLKGGGTILVVFGNG